MVSVPGGNYVHSLSDSASSLTPLLEKQASHASTCLLSQGSTDITALLRSNSLTHSPPVAATVGWPHVSDPQLLSLFATTAAAAPVSAAPSLTDLRVSSHASPHLSQYGQPNSQWAVHTSEPTPNSQWAVHRTSGEPAPNSQWAVHSSGEPTPNSQWAVHSSGEPTPNSQWAVRANSEPAPVNHQWAVHPGNEPAPNNQWAVHTNEPPQTAVLAALQSIQLKLQVQEQVVEFHTLEKQNQFLISNLLTAQQSIQELQAEVAMLQHTVDKVENASRMSQQEQRAREQALQQRHSQLTSSNMEAEIAIQQLEASLAEAKKKQKELNYSNIMLSLGFPLTAPAGKGGRSGNSSYANRKCYNCGQKGHRAADCPNPRTRPDATSDGARSSHSSKTGSDTSSNMSETHGSPKFPTSPVKSNREPSFSPPKFPSTPAKTASKASPMATQSPTKTPAPASPVKTPVKNPAAPDSPLKAPSTPDAAILVTNTARTAAAVSPPQSPPKCARNILGHSGHPSGANQKQTHSVAPTTKAAGSGVGSKPGSPASVKSGKKKSGCKSRSRTPSPASSPVAGARATKGSTATGSVIPPMTPPASCKSTGM